MQHRAAAGTRGRGDTGSWHRWATTGVRWNASGRTRDEGAPLRGTRFSSRNICLSVARTGCADSRHDTV